MWKVVGSEQIQLVRWRGNLLFSILGVRLCQHSERSSDNLRGKDSIHRQEYSSVAEATTKGPVKPLNFTDKAKQPTETSSQLNEKQLGRENTILKWLGISHPQLSEQKLILLTLQNRVERLCRTSGPRASLNFIIRVLKEERSKICGTQPGTTTLTPESLKAFVDLRIVRNCLHYALVNDTSLKSYHLAAVTEMAQLSVIPQNRRLAWLSLKALVDSKDDNLEYTVKWFNLFNKQYNVSLSGYELTFSCFTKNTHLSARYRLDKLRLLVQDLSQSGQAPTLFTFKAIFRVYALLTDGNIVASLTTIAEIEQLELWFTRLSLKPDVALLIYLMNIYHNLSAHSHVLRKYDKLLEFNLPQNLAATNLLLSAMAWHATPPKNPHSLPEEKLFEVNQSYSRCLDIFSRLEAKKEVDLYSITVMLKLCIARQDKEKSNWVLSVLKVNDQIAPDKLLLSELLRHHAIYGELDEMIEVYNLLPEPNHDHLWSMMSGLIKRNRIREASTFYWDYYHQSFPTPNSQLALNLLDAYARSLDLSCFELLYKQLVELQLVSAPVFELRMKLAVQFRNTALFSSTFQDIMASNMVPTNAMITSILDYVLNQASDTQTSWSALELAAKATELVSSDQALIDSSPSQRQPWEQGIRLFRRQALKAAQLRLGP